MTTVHKKRHGGIRRWLVRNALSLALIGIILLSMTAGAIGCLAFLPKPQDTSTPETKTDVSTATVTQPDITSPSLDPIPEPQVFYFDVPLSEELQDYIREKGSTVVAECKVEDNASVKSVVEFDIETYDSIRIEILKWCLPHHRPRIAEIFVGVNKVYGKSDITGYEHEQDINPIGATTPVNKMGFSIDNSNNIYDPNNTTGLSKYLMERQEMRVKYGLKLNDGTIEYI